MRVSGTMAAEIAKLATAPGFTARNESERTVRFAQRLRRGAALEVPVVTKDLRLAVGEAVIAAHMVNGATHVRVHVIDCSQAELELLRKYDQRSKRTRAMDVISRLIDITEPEVEEHWRNTRYPTACATYTARHEARKWIGEVLGIEPRTMRNYDRLERIGKSKPEKEVRVWELQCHGWEPAPGLQDEAKAVRSALEKVDNRLRQNQVDLRPLCDMTGLAWADNMYAAAKQAAVGARHYMPAHICPYCKSTVAVRPTCLGCGGAGWVKQDTWDNAPEQLRTEYLVSHAGQFLDPLTMQPPFRRAPPGRAASFVGNAYEEEEEW